jgi:16S rRNA (uracil1498-N3)-methyltransferase
MADRYFVSSPITGSQALLVDDEARHLAQVMRAKPGDEIAVFDGGGSEWLGRIASIGRSAVEVELIEQFAVDRESASALTLGVALPKGDRQRWLVEKAVELGVHCLVPLVTERGVAQPVEKALARLRRTVIEASKQCGRNRLMEIAEPLNWPAWCESTPPGESAARLVADPRADQALSGWLASASRDIGDVAIAVGPEGGFSDGELAFARARGWLAVNLGPRVLRVETAALYVAAAVGWS